MELMCEYVGCTTGAIADYRRKLSDLVEDEEGPLSELEKEEWLDEPIALCQAHSTNHQPYDQY